MKYALFCTMKKSNKSCTPLIQLYLKIIHNLKRYVLFSQKDPSKLSEFGRAMLHGKGYDRWFDKSFTLVVTSNGRVCTCRVSSTVDFILTLLLSCYTHKVHVFILKGRIFSLFLTADVFIEELIVF